MTTYVTFGIERTVNNEKPAFQWFSCKEDREQAVADMAAMLFANADNTRVMLRRALKLDDGSLHVEVGGPALHSQWRHTLFRASGPTGRLLQAAVVDVISGRVFIVDSVQPFSATQHEEFASEQHLIVQVNEGGKTEPFRAYPAPSGMDCHYTVLSRADLCTLRDCPAVAAPRAGARA